MKEANPPRTFVDTYFLKIRSQRNCRGVTSQRENFLISKLSQSIRRVVARKTKGNTFFREFLGCSIGRVKARFLFFTGSQPDLSHAERKVHEAGSILAFPLPVELSLPNSRNKRLVHQGSPRPEHFYHRNPFPLRICTTLVLTSPSKVPVTPPSLSLSLSLCHILSVDPRLSYFFHLNRFCAPSDSRLLRLSARGTQVLESRKFYYCLEGIARHLAQRSLFYMYMLTVVHNY